MSVPLAQPGHPDAQQPAPPQIPKTEDLGEGHISGNLTHDPEMRFTPGGDAVVRLRVAYTPRFREDGTGEWRDGDTEYYDVIVWKQQGTRAVECLVRGDRVLAIGRWTKRYWLDNTDKLRDTTELTARDIGPSLLFREAVIKRPARGNGQT